MKYKLTESTLRFSIVGFFIPGFTMMFVAIVQMMLAQLINDCEIAWNLIFVLTTIGAFIAPIVFGRQAIQWDLRTAHYQRKLFGYNLMEYTFLQVSIGWLYGNSYTLCNVTDGQNGLQFVFTAWMGIILLNVYSLMLDLINSKHHS